VARAAFRNASPDESESVRNYVRDYDPAGGRVRSNGVMSQ